MIVSIYRRASLKKMFAALEEEQPEWKEGFDPEESDRWMEKSIDLIKSDGTKNRDFLMSMSMSLTMYGKEVNAFTYDLIEKIAHAPEGNVSQAVGDFIFSHLGDAEDVVVKTEEIMNSSDILHSMIKGDGRDFFKDVYEEVLKNQGTENNLETLFKLKRSSDRSLLERLNDFCGEGMDMMIKSFFMNTKSAELLWKAVRDNDLPPSAARYAIENPNFPALSSQQLIDLMDNDNSYSWLTILTNMIKRKDNISEDVFTHMLSSERILKHMSMYGPFLFDLPELSLPFKQLILKEALDHSNADNKARLIRMFDFNFNSTKWKSNPQARILINQLRDGILYNGNVDIKLVEYFIKFQNFLEEKDTEYIFKTYPQLSRQISCNIAISSNFSQEMLNSVFDPEDVEIMSLLAQNKQSDSELLRKIFNSAKNIKDSKNLKSIIKSLSLHKNTPSDVLDGIVDKYWSPEIGKEVVLNPNISDETVQKIMKRRSEKVKILALEKTEDNSAFMKMMSETNNLEVFQYLYKERGLSSEDLQKVYDKIMSSPKLGKHRIGKTGGLVEIFDFILRQKNISKETAKKIIKDLIGFNARGCLSPMSMDNIWKLNDEEINNMVFNQHPELIENDVFCGYYEKGDTVSRQPKELRQKIFRSYDKNHKILVLISNNVNDLNFFLAKEDLEELCSSLDTLKIKSRHLFMSEVSKLIDLVAMQDEATKKKLKSKLEEGMKSLDPSEQTACQYHINNKL